MKHTVITPEPDGVVEYFRKIWRYRSLIWVFGVRDLKVKYAQTWLGLGWSILQPLTALAVFTFFFGYLLKMKAGQLPYVIYILSGVIGWNFFAYIVNAGTQSVQESSNLIKKIYFPKSILPLSKVLVAAVELGISFLLLIPLILYYGQPISWKIIFFPFIVLFNTFCGLTLVFWITAFAYKKRDLYHLIPYVVYFGIWVTPVFFTREFLPNSVRSIMMFNPMANVVELWRWSLFSYSEFSFLYILNVIVVLILCLSGMYFFNRREIEFSDFA